MSDKSEAILAALRTKSPQSPGDLMKRLKLRNLATLRYQLQPLMKSGAVTVAGATANRLITLAGKPRPKEVP